MISHWLLAVLVLCTGPITTSHAASIPDTNLQSLTIPAIIKRSDAYKSSTANLGIINGGFESSNTSIAPWQASGTTGVSAIIFSGDVHGGNNGLEITAQPTTTGSFVYDITQTINVVSGTNYLFSAYVADFVLEGVSQCDVGIYLSFGPNGRRDLIALTSFSSTTNFQELSGTSVVFESTATVTVEVKCFVVTQPSTNSPAWFWIVLDDIVATPVGSNLVKNGGFESGNISPWIAKGSGAQVLVDSLVKFDGSYRGKIVYNSTKSATVQVGEPFESLNVGSLYEISIFWVADSTISFTDCYGTKAQFFVLYKGQSKPDLYSSWFLTGSANAAVWSKETAQFIAGGSSGRAGIAYTCASGSATFTFNIFIDDFSITLY
jgi:hypothetical protein